MRVINRLSLQKAKLKPLHQILHRWRGFSVEINIQQITPQPNLVRNLFVNASILADRNLAGVCDVVRAIGE